MKWVGSKIITKQNVQPHVVDNKFRMNKSKSTLCPGTVNPQLSEKTSMVVAQIWVPVEVLKHFIYV
jgi:hypothetical protein